MPRSKSAVTALPRDKRGEHFDFLKSSVCRGVNIPRATQKSVSELTAPTLDGRAVGDLPLMIL